MDDLLKSEGSSENNLVDKWESIEKKSEVLSMTEGNQLITEEKLTRSPP